MTPRRVPTAHSVVAEAGRSGCVHRQPLAFAVGESAWKHFLVLGLLGVVLCAVTSGNTQGVIAEVVGIASVVAIVGGVRTWGRARGRAWYCFAIGGTFVLVGNAVLVVSAAVSGDPDPTPSPADAFYLLGYIAVVTGEVLLVRRRSADIEGDNLIDALILATCVGVVVWAYILMPYVKDPAVGLSEKVLNFNYSLLTLIVVAVAARLAVGSGRRNPSYYFLAASFACLLFSDVSATVGGARNGLAVTSSALTFVLCATAALHPSMARITDRPADREIQLTRRRLSLLCGALLVVPALLVVNAVAGEGANVTVMAAGSVALSVLVLSRLAGLVRAKDRKAERERILREAGEALVAATSREQIYRAALLALPALLPEDQAGRVSMMAGSCDQLKVVAAKGKGGELALDTPVDVTHLPMEVRHGLARLELVMLERCPPIDLPSSAGSETERAVLILPLSRKKEMRGAVVVTTDRVLGPDAVRTVEALANQVSLALESAALTEEIHQRRHERRFRALVENSSDLVSVIGPDGRASFVSPASFRLLGVPEWEMVGEHPFARMHPDDRYEASALLDRAWAVPGLREQVEARLGHRSGDWRWFEIVTENLLDEPEVAGMVIHARDITDRKEAQLRLVASEARFRSLVQHASDVVIVLEGDLVMSYVSPSLNRLLGRSHEQLVGRSWLDLVHSNDATRARELSSSPPARRETELRVRHRDGSWLTLDLTVSDLRHDPAVRGIVLNGRDVTDRRVLEHRLRHQALHDGLTGLANRTLFTDRVTHALSRRSGPWDAVAVLFIDLDDFKTVNDGLGHAAGDALLAEVGSRLAACLRSGDTAARLGGDEFAVLLDAAVDEDGVIEIVERVQEALRVPFSVDGDEMRVTASIGVALDQGALTSADVLLRNADVAMYQAKSKGKNRHQLFEAGMHTVVRERFELKGDLARGLEEGRFRLLYQPIVSLSTGAITGFEALLRWHHPRQGVLSPDTFIPLAEETGLIVPLGEWVLEEAGVQLRRWRDRHPELSLGISANVSVRQLESRGFYEQVRAAIEHSGAPPSSLSLEITESTLMADVEMTCRRLSELKQLDVTIAVDDFGTGYSSIGYLQRLPLDVVKVDRSVIQPLGHRACQADAIRAIVDLARSYGLATVAEGIEDGEQVGLLRNLGCNGAQGYHLSRPVTTDAVDLLLRRPRPIPAS